MFNKKTVKDIGLKGKRVLVRADYNVPLDEDGKITDDYRIKQSLPTLQYLLDAGASLVICSHLGRPDGKVDQKYSLAPVVRRLNKLLGRHVFFAKDCVGEVTTQLAKDLKPGQVLVLENLRFHKEEEENDPTFAKQLASLADVFVQDAFGVVHRAHASTDSITEYLPSVSGLLLAKEVDTITDVVQNPKKPLMAIIGGAKIEDKLEVLKRLISLADLIAVGGAMANTFLLAEGVDIGKSVADKSEVPLAKEILALARAKAKKQAFVFYLPQDGVVAKKIGSGSHTRIVDWDAHVIADIENYPKKVPRSSTEIESDEMILDIGPFSGAFMAGAMQLANTVIWNGAMGVTETDGLQGPIGPFAQGTELIVEALQGNFGHKPFSLVGGGDTVGYIEERKLTDSFDHVSTGGGASIELLSGKKLPGVEALENK